MILSVIYTMIILRNIMMNIKNYLMLNTSLETSDLKIIKINNFFDKKIQKLIKNKNQKIKHQKKIKNVKVNKDMVSKVNKEWIS